MIKDLSPSDLPQIVDLHLKILYWSINSKLGRAHLEKLYSELLNSNECINLGYFSKSGALIGVIIGTADQKATRARLFSPKTYPISTLLKLLWQNLIRPKNLVDLMENYFLVPGAINKVGTNGEILIFITDFTSPEATSFVAYRCFMAMKKKFLERGLTSVFAQVARYDSRPNMFHSSAGSIRFRSFMRNNIYIINC